MNFTVNVNKFRSHVATVTPVIGKSFLPVMNNILIKSNGTKIALFGGNTTQMISAEFECSSTPGVCTVPAGKLLSLLNSLPQDEDVTFDADDEKAVATLTVASGCFTLLGHPAADYPILEVPENAVSATLPDGALAAMISHCKNAVNKDETRPALAGMYLHFQADSTTAVATDGKRMAVYSITAENSPELQSVIVPNSALGLLSKLSGEATLTANNNLLEVKTDNVTIVTKLIAGTYPNYNTVIPQRFSECIEVDGQLLANAIKLVTPLVEVNQAVNVKFSGECMELSASNTSIGSANYQIPLERGTTEPIEVTLNPLFILNALNGTKEKVSVKLNNTLSPLSLNHCDEVFTIIMPLRRK